MTDYKAIAQDIMKNRYCAVAIRSVCDDENYSVGDWARESYEHDMEEDCSTYETTGLTAGGTCGTEVNLIDINLHDEDDIPQLIEKIKRAVEINSSTYSYNGTRQVIIAGDDTVDGCMDDGEVRIIDAKVIAIID